MPNNVKLATSRKALVARGALVAFISPKLANDAQIDYSKILKGITAENWVENRPVLLSRIKIATNGKLANDEDLDGMDGVLKMLDKTGEDEKDEEEETEEEKKEREAKDKRARDEKEEEEKREKEAKDKRARDRRARDKRARDNETEDEREEREAEDRRARDEKEEEEKREKEAKDKRARDEEREKEKAEDKKAMDAAIENAKKQWHQEQRAMLEARDLVTPVIGAVHAQDSAAAYYELLFTKHDVDTTGVPPAGYRALAATVIKGLQAPKPVARVKHANDSALADFNKRVPDVARIRHA